MHRFVISTQTWSKVWIRGELMTFGPDQYSFYQYWSMMYTLTKAFNIALIECNFLQMIIQKKQERRRKRHEIRSAQQLRESSPEENPPPSEPYQKENTMPAKFSSASSKYNKPVAEVHPHSAPHHQSSFTSGLCPRIKNFCFLIYLVILWHRMLGEGML